ncbi:Biotin transport ATP-binding protein BioM [Marinobacterium sp. xm-a-121]|jgi:biotin transport system ATP-binding protein|uniref:energy-coupling factor ABC transporter ATP-binding protein n=1 Tax=unclassified Marinobacterium TaxID=2644139 RepID=UPI001569BB56|nr:MULTISPECIES: ABC transporter ATP-binding protein [unclassified Marinobacterium]NRP38819.1 Biotin transport ATP-binding protein BioM [Marinobacterium sp. xm-a-121]NRP99635.1 Biotin transport ATP-binding protein BioM [Marinobacterium sp. xm-v-233]
MHTPSIELSHVTLTREGRTIFDDLSLSLNESRIGIIGFNGSGKSSLIRLLNGLLAADSGTISINGKDPSKGPAAMSTEVGFVFQNPDHQLIFPTVLEELIFGLQNQGKDKSESEAEALALLKEHDRLDWKDLPVHSLSEGQKQLICIFSVLLLKPKVIVFDEPFSALDLPTRYQLQKVISSLSQQVIMISHELDGFDGFDRLVWIGDQGVVKDGSIEEVINDYKRHAVETAES